MTAEKVYMAVKKHFENSDVKIELTGSSYGSTYFEARCNFETTFSTIMKNVGRNAKGKIKKFYPDRTPIPVQLGIKKIFLAQ